MVRDTMYAVVLPGKFNVMVSQDSPNQVLTATLEYAGRKARMRKVRPRSAEVDTCIASS
jgi:hypothetical protein